MQKKKITKKALKHKIIELEAQLASSYYFADTSIKKASKKYMMASGVLLNLHALGGAEIIPPVVIRDGLSDATIKAIRADIVRSYQRATENKPSGVEQHDMDTYFEENFSA